MDASSDHLRSRRRQPEHGKRGHAFAASRFPDEADKLSRPHLEADSIDRFAGTPASRDLYGQAVHSQGRSSVAGTVRPGFLGRHQPFKSGSSQSRSPSPRRLKPRTAMKMAEPGTM